MHIHSNQKDIIIREGGLDIKRKRACKGTWKLSKQYLNVPKWARQKLALNQNIFCKDLRICICHSPATILFLIGTICKAGFSNPSLDKIQYLCALYMSFCTKTENDMGFRYLLCRTEQCQ